MVRPLYKSTGSLRVIGRSGHEYYASILLSLNWWTWEPFLVERDTQREISCWENSVKLFKDNESENIVLCSKDVFEDNSTTFCKYLPVALKGKYLDPQDVLQTLGNSGFTSIMIEGGKKILESFISENLINEIHLYTSNKIIDNSKLPNPLKIDESWEILNERKFENDKLVVARKKELCLQES